MAPRKNARRIEYMPLDELPPALVNPKGHDLEGIAANIKAHGFVEPPLLDDRTGRLIGGHGRKEVLTAMRDAGDPVPEGITARPDGAWLVPIVRGWSSTSDEAAEAMLVALNRLPEAGGWNEAELLDMLDRIDAAGLDMTVTGFGPDDLADLRASIDEATTPDDLTRHAIDPSAGIAPGEPSLPDRLADYTTKGIRSVIMDLDLAAYGWFAEHAPAIRSRLSVETNVDMLLRLMAKELGVEPPPALSPTEPDTAPAE